MIKTKYLKPEINVLNITLECALVANSAIVLPVDGSGKVREEWTTDEVFTNFEW